MSSLFEFVIVVAIMDGEIINFIKVWISALASLTYCYFISFNIPKGTSRFLSLLPVFYFLTIPPLNLYTISLGGTTAFFLTWLANFKILLFSIGQGPLSSDPSISLSHFISIASLPIQPPSLQKSKASPKSPLNVATKVLVLALLMPIYQYKPKINPKLMLACYCFYLYIGLEIILAIVAALAEKFLGIESGPQFNEPYLSTSLQDFWGRRWNLMVTNILRPIVYEPTKLLSSKIIGRKLATIPALLCTFVLSGVMHEIMYYYIGRVPPTWEITWFFVLQGVLVAIEVLVKKMMRGRWSLHPVVSWAYTVAILMVTGNWLFFPQLLRCNTDVRVSREVGALFDCFKWFGTFIGISAI